MIDTQDKKGTIIQHVERLKKDLFKIEVQVMDGGKLPTKAYLSDAGFDLYATSDITLYPGHVLKHPLNIRMKLPHGTWAEITTKSGLGSKGQLVYAGVIDEAYRGVPHVVMTNVKMFLNEGDSGYLTSEKNQHGHVRNLEPIVIKKGEKLAQLVMSPYSPNFYLEQVDSVDTNTDRGDGGFGSTGKL
jgi:dUTP pyrophosphatase